MRMTMTRPLGAVAGSVALAAAVLASPGAAVASPGGAGAGPGRTAATAAATGGVLNGVAITSARSAWAVGCASGNCSAPTARTLILHWTGRAWKRQASPAPNPGSTLFGVAATSAGNAWAVGYTGFARTLILHWNGRAWRRVASPDPLGGADFLLGVTALSARSAWAVGYGYPKTGGWRTLILHWNGAMWRQVPSPTPGVPSELSAVTAVSARSAWAVGSYSADGSSGALAEHWNGTAWKQVASPSVPTHASPTSGLTGVAASSAGTAWEAGFTSTGLTLIGRWTGTRFRQVPSPSPGPGPSGGGSASLSAVAANSAVSAWSVGEYAPGTGGVRTLVLRWDGAAWKQVASPTPGGYGVLTGVAVHPGSLAWSVGYRCVAKCDAQAQTDEPLILHWTGRAWRSVPSPHG